MKKKVTLCDWCNAGEKDTPVVPACVRVTFTDLEGVILDGLSLCGPCAKRGVTFDGRIADTAT
jgi:hypothetical protein